MNRSREVVLLLSPRNFIERLVILEEEGGAGSFNNVISPKDLEFLRRIGNKLMQLSLDRGGSRRVDERGGVNQLLLPSFILLFLRIFSFFFFGRDTTISPFPRLIVAIIPPLGRNFRIRTIHGAEIERLLTSHRFGSAQLTYFLFFSFLRARKLHPRTRF